MRRCWSKDRQICTIEWERSLIKYPFNRNHGTIKFCPERKFSIHFMNEVCCVKDVGLKINSIFSSNPNHKWMPGGRAHVLPWSPYGNSPSWRRSIRDVPPSRCVLRSAASCVRGVQRAAHPRRFAAPVQVHRHPRHSPGGHALARRRAGLQLGTRPWLFFAPALVGAYVLRARAEWKGGALAGPAAHRVPPRPHAAPWKLPAPPHPPRPPRCPAPCVAFAWPLSPPRRRRWVVVDARWSSVVRRVVRRVLHRSTSARPAV